MNTKTFKIGDIRTISIHATLGQAGAIGSECRVDGEKIRDGEGFMIMGVKIPEDLKDGEVWQISFRAGGPTGGHWDFDKKIK